MAAALFILTAMLLAVAFVGPFVAVWAIAFALAGACLGRQRRREPPAMARPVVTASPREMRRMGLVSNADCN